MLGSILIWLPVILLSHGQNSTWDQTAPVVNLPELVIQDACMSDFNSIFSFARDYTNN